MSTSNQNNRTKPFSLLLSLALVGWVSGCMVDTTIEGDEFADETLANDVEDGAENTNQSSSELSSVLSCQGDIDCRYGCYCGGGQCIAKPLGPLPPASYCATPPTRACNSDSDCKFGCYCGTDNKCTQVPIAPLDPYPRCHLPPQGGF